MITQDILAGMIGIMLFFTVVVAPTVFKVLPVEWSGKYVRHFFPKYYASLGILCLIAALASRDSQALVILLISALLFAFLRFYFTHQINRAKDGHHATRFRRLHALSVLINVGQLLAFVYLLAS
jgi:hypothetical protein